MIEIANLSKSFGRLRALDSVTFSVGKGEVVGFLGANGAGKTTTLRVVCGFLAPDAGRVLVDGIDVSVDPVAAQRRLGYLAEGAPLHEEMRALAYLEHRARLKGVPSGRVRERARDALAAAHATDVADRRVGALSRGMRQRVGLADALVAEPPVLVLDEPTSGLDPAQTRDTRALLKELARERTVLLSTHALAEVEALAARVVVIAAGRVVTDAPLASLRAGTRVRVRDEAAALAALGDGAERVGEGLVRTPLPPDEAARRLAAAGVDVLELTARPLEELFLG